MTAVLQTYFLFTRFFLHSCATAIIYLAFIQWKAMSRIRFSLIILPFAVFVEYIQFARQVTDSISKVVLIRDTIFVLLIISLAFIFDFFKAALSTQVKIVLSITMMVLLIIASLFIEQYKPAGQNFFYKHILDIMAYVSGPLIIYPFVAKYFF